MVMGDTMGDTIIIINPGQMFVKFSGYFRVKGAWAMCQVGCRCVKSVTPHLHGLLLSLKQMLMVPDGAYCLFGNFINQHGKQLEPCLLHIDICNIYIYIFTYIYIDIPTTMSPSFRLAVVYCPPEINTSQ